MQIVSLKVRNHTIIKSWSSLAARAPFNSYYQHWVRKIGGKTLFSTHDQDFYQTHYIFQLYPSITFNVRLVGVYWTLDFWAGRRLGILIRLSLLWNWSGSFLDLRMKLLTFSNCHHHHLKLGFPTLFFFNFSPSRYPRYPRCTDWDLIWHWWSLCDTNVDLLMILILLTLFSIWC